MSRLLHRRSPAAAGRALLVVGCALLAAGCSETASQSTRPGQAADSIAEVLREPDAFARTARLAAALPTLGPDAVPEARRLLGDRGIDLDFADIVLLVRYWATHDPEAATQWAWKKTATGLGVGPLVAASELWARADPQAVVAQIRWAGPGPTTAQVEKALVRGWLASGLPGLEDYLRELGASEESGQRAFRAYARERIRRDGPEAVMRWAESLPDEPWRVKLTAYRQVALELGLADPDAATAWCQAHCQDGRLGSNLLKLVAQGMAMRDGAAAMEWLSQAPPGKERDRAVREALFSWRNIDRDAAIAWMEELGVDGVEPWLQPGIYTHALTIGSVDPARGIEWTEAIEPAEARRDAQVLVAHWWHGADPEAAEAWLQQSPLSEEDRERVRAPLLRRQKWVDPSEPED